MENWIIFIIIIIIFIVFRLLNNLIKLRSIKKFYSDYQEYLKDPKYSFSEKTPLIVKLFKQADIDNSVITRLSPKGYGYLQNIETNIFSNLTLIDQEVETLITRKFHEAIGIYKSRVYETINPLFWIEFALKLPTYIAKYIGLKTETKLSKLLQIIYWIIGIIIGLEKLGIIKITELIN